MEPQQIEDWQAVVADNQLRFEIVDFLYKEAELLDGWQLRDWLDLLTDDIEYRMPVRSSRVQRGRDFSDRAYHYDETKASLDSRVRRFETEYAWAEHPPSRTKRYVTNIRRQGLEGDEHTVKSNILCVHMQGDTPDHTILVGEREDRLRRTSEGLKLSKRDIFLHHTILDINYITFFL